MRVGADPVGVRTVECKHGDAVLPLDATVSRPHGRPVYRYCCARTQSFV